MKKNLALVLALVMCLSLFAGCGNKADDTTNKNDPAPGTSTPADKADSSTVESRDTDGNGRIDKVYYALGMDPVNLLPWSSKSNQRKIFYAAIYDTLFDFIDGEYVPNVATGYTEIDELHWEVKINENVVDWEGNPLTAYDVEFCYGNYVNSGYASKFNNFAGIEATDDYTLIFTWKNPNTAVAGLDHVFCNVQLYTEAAWSEDKFATAPVATGPYKLVEYVSGSKVVVEVNENYWNENPTSMRQQNADMIEYSVVAESSQNVIGLQTGKLDISSNIPSENFADFASDSNYYTEEVAASGTYGIIVNCETIVDPNMRQALFYAIDNVALSTAVQGTAPTTAYGSPAAPDYVEAWDDMETYYNTYDLAKAQSLIDKSSYDGATLKIMANTGEAYKTIAEMAQVFWEQIGVKTDITVVDGTTLTANTTDSSKWDIIIADFGGTFLVNSMNRIFNTSDFGGEYSIGFVVDEKLWDLFNKANTNTTWGDESLTEFYQYSLDMGYHYILLYMTSSAVASNAISEFYYWDSVILPHCCEYNI